MKPIALTLLGFRGIWDGLNRQELHLGSDDLTAGELIALKGATGRGKSTILDNLQPYRFMPARAKSPSPEAFSWYDHIVGEQAEKLLEWEHQGQRYLSQIQIQHKKKTRALAAYLFQRQGEEWVPARGRDGLESDGRANSYDRLVEGILGSPALFCTSAFAAQFRKPIGSYTQSEIKALLSELLEVDSLYGLGERANTVYKALLKRIHWWREQRADSATLEQREQQLREKLETLGERIREQYEAIAEYEGKVEQIQTERAQALVEREQRQQLLQQREQVKQRLNELHRERDQRLDMLRADYKQAQHQEHERKQQVAEQLGRLDERRQRLEGQRQRYQTIQAEADAIRAAEQHIAALDQTIQSLDEQEQACLVELDEHTAAEQRYQLLLREQHQVANDIQRVEKTLQELDTRGHLVSEVPCRGTELQAQCQLLADAHQAIEARGQYHAELEQLQTQLDQHRQSAQELASAVGQRQAIQAKLDDIRQHQKENKHTRQQYQRQAEQASLLAEAEQRLQEIQNELDAVQQEAEHIRLTDTQAAQAHADRLAALVQQSEGVKTDYAERIQRVQGELDALPSPEDNGEDKVSALENRLAGVRHSIQEHYNEARQNEHTIAQTQAEIEQVSQQIERARRLDTTTQTLSDEASHWKLLADAFSHKGIIALVIDDAGPELARLANELLIAAYGHHYTVGIQTQTTTQKGELRETFQVQVFTGAGDEKTLDELSGGERIYVQEAICRGMALYQAERSDRHYHCLFSDETDGSLDADKKLQYVRMKRKVLELGGYEREIFITHTPELWQLADHIIDLEEYRQ